MDSIFTLPTLALDATKPFGAALKKKNANTLLDAALFLRDMPYGFLNSRDLLAALEAETGTCVHKHGILAASAKEIGVPVFKALGIYAMDTKLVPSIEKILADAGIDFIPATHCFLVYGHYRVDLTEGNCNGKTGPIESYMHIQTIHPEVSEEEEKTLYFSFLEKQGHLFMCKNSIDSWRLLKECSSVMKCALSCSV